MCEIERLPTVGSAKKDTMQNRHHVPGWSIVFLFLLVPVDARASHPLPGIEAHLRPAAYRIPIGQPVWVQFAVENTTNEPITLTVPNTRPQIPAPEIGLPLSHVFSGDSTSGVAVTTTSGRLWDRPVGYIAPSEAPILILGSHCMVGTTLDLREYFPALRVAGEFRIRWSPYAPTEGNPSVVLTIAGRKRVQFDTDEGKLLIELSYESAPNHVANFLDLTRSGFYSGKTFHRLEPGYLIQGGCPRGDGTGIRFDGKRIAAELNSYRHQKGSVSMALLENDPDSASCQFFICYTKQKDWDGRYTVFGQLIGDESFETLDRLMAVPVDDRSRPARALYIRSARAMDAPAQPPRSVP